MLSGKGSAATAEVAFSEGSAIRCEAPDGSETFIAPVPLYGCSSVIWLEWQDWMESPQEIPFHDGVQNRVSNHDAELVPYEETPFGHPPKN